MQLRAVDRSWSEQWRIQGGGGGGFQKNPFRSITIFFFFFFLGGGANLAVPANIIFNISLILTHSSPPTAGSARTQCVRQRRGLARRVLAVPETGNSHAQNGSSSFRSPAFSRSTGSSFRSPCPNAFFTLPRHIPTNICGDYPPPPPPPGGSRGEEATGAPFLKFDRL